MRVIAFTNQKGGVGKTTSTSNVGAALAKRGYKVLMLDLDSQANLTTDLGIEDPTVTITDILFKDADPIPYVINERLHLIAGSAASANFEGTAKGIYNDADVFFILKEYFEQLELDYDFILIDCPPAIGTLIANIYIMSDELLIPMEIDINAISGLQMVLATVRNLQRRLNLPEKKVKVFFTKYEQQTLISEAFTKEMHQTYGDILLKSAIRINGAAIKTAAFKRQGLLSYAPDSNGARDYEQLTEEILKH